MIRTPENIVVDDDKVAPKPCRLRTVRIHTRTRRRLRWPKGKKRYSYISKEANPSMPTSFPISSPSFGILIRWVFPFFHPIWFLAVSQRSQKSRHLNGASATASVKYLHLQLKTTASFANIYDVVWICFGQTFVVLFCLLPMDLLRPRYSLKHEDSFNI